MKHGKPVVTYITTGLGTGGAEMMLHQLVAGIDRARFDQSVISLTDDGKYADLIRDLGVPVYSLGLPAGKPTLGGLVRLWKTIRRLDPDLLVGWMYHGNLTAMLARLFLFKRLPVLWNVRQSLYSLSYEKRGSAAVIRLLATFSRFAAQITYNSEISARQHEALGYSAVKTALIPNGFNTATLQPSVEARGSVRAELGLPADAPLIGRFGRYAEMKDYATFLDAAAHLLTTKPAHFMLVGTHVDGNNEALTAQIKKLGIAVHVHLLGERQDVPRLTAALDIACSSSAFGEGFPNVIGEAMSCGVPCVATDVGDSAWVIGDTGFIVPPKCPPSLSRVWYKILAMSYGERRGLGQSARTRIETSFSLGSVIRRYEELYERQFAPKTLKQEEKLCVG